MPSPNLVTKAQLAALANVSRAHVTQETRPGGAFCEARVGQRVDVDHPSIANWLRSKGVDPTTGLPTPAAKAKPKGAKPTQTAPKSDSSRKGIEDSGSSAEPAKWLSLTLSEIVRRFGGEPQFSNWLKAVKMIEDIRGHRLDNEETEHSLISRELVQRTILSLVEEQNQKLLHELPRTLARQVHTQAKAGQGLEASERDVRKLIGQTLDGTQKKLIKRLRKARK